MDKKPKVWDKLITPFPISIPPWIFRTRDKEMETKILWKTDLKDNNK